MRFHFRDEGAEFLFARRWCEPLHPTQIMGVTVMTGAVQDVIDIATIDEALGETTYIAKGCHPMLSGMGFDPFAHGNHAIAPP